MLAPIVPIKMQPYRSAMWRKFRDEVIHLDGGACVRCRRTEADGVILQVHHKSYKPGAKPWEYPYDSCETRCRGCHAEEHGRIPPRFGWEFIGQDDLEDLIGICENCGTSIRYIFLIAHEKWPPIEVGTICCDHLTDSHVASDEVESLLRYNQRRKRFVSSPRWLNDPYGNAWITQKRIKVRIIPDGNRLRLQMNGFRGKLQFDSLLTAKMKAFEVIESGVLRKFLEKAANKGVSSDT